MSYYDGKLGWCQALKMAKKKFRQYLVIYNGFPERGKHLCEAAQILACVIEDLKDEKIVFDPGWFFNLVFVYILVMLFTALEQTREMNCLVSGFILTVDMCISEY